MQTQLNILKSFKQGNKSCWLRSNVQHLLKDAEFKAALATSWGNNATKIVIKYSILYLIVFQFYIKGWLDAYSKCICANFEMWYMFR